MQCIVMLISSVLYWSEQEQESNAKTVGTVNYHCIHSSTLLDTALLLL